MAPVPTQGLYSLSGKTSYRQISWSLEATRLDVIKHDDVIKWKHFPRYWPFVRGIHRSPVNSTHKGQWHGALMLPLIAVWTNAWVNNRDAGDLRRYRVHYDVTIMIISLWNLTGISTALQRCRDACQISEWLGKSKPESHGVETSRDLAERRPSASISE